MPILGYKELLGKNHSDNDINDNTLFLLMGPGRCGKTTYCKTFFESNLKNGSNGIFFSSTFTKKQYQNLFNGLSDIINSRSYFINPFLREQTYSNEERNNDTDNNLSELKKELDKVISSYKTEQKNQFINANENNLPLVQQNRICMVVDSLSHLFNIFDEKDVLRFINSLSFSLKNSNVLSIFTIDDTIIDRYLIEKIRPIFDGVLQIKMDEKEEELIRQIRFLSLTGISLYQETWVKFELDKNTSLLTFPNSSSFICSVCKASIKTKPVFYLDMAFHEKHLDLYKKLTGIYGHTGISDLGPSSVINANFFFIDIVGLSSPTLSVRKQIEKIEFLNNFIISSEIFRKNSDKKVLPTGDGMAIGFTSNPEAPLNLSIQLHYQLKKHNLGKDNESSLAVRIGIASGPVFIVNDANNNQNIWGPGIIFARRVMDVGDNNHILIDGGLAISLLTLDDKYKELIHFVADYQIKHGQIIKIYSAYQENKFGNKSMPTKVKHLPI